MKRVYISGKIDGLPMKQAVENFKKVTEDVESREGFQAVNPLQLLSKYKGKSKEFYRREALALLLTCDEICVMRERDCSEGVKLEIEVARAAGIPVTFVM